MNVLVLALTFLAINLDFFIMMLFLLKKYPFRSVLFGFMAATMLLMVLCFIAGQLLESFFARMVAWCIRYHPNLCGSER